MGYLDNTGLAYFWQKIKSNFFPGTKLIPGNSDLNDYTTPGVYYCPSSATVATLDNVPVPYAFSLQVYRTVWNPNGEEGCRQIFMAWQVSDIDENTNRIWTRAYHKPSNNDGSWSDWYQIVTSMDRPVDYTSAGWTLNTHADHCWHKMATFRTTKSSSDRRAVFLVTDSYWYNGVAPNGRPDLKIGLLHVHIRKTIGACAVRTRKLSFNLNAGYDLNDFVLVYNPVDDSDELWTRVAMRYTFRTFNLIETGLPYGGNRYRQTTENPIEMYRRVQDSEGYASYPTGEGYEAIKAENSAIEQPSRGLLDLGVYYDKLTTKRLTTANAFLAGHGVLEYFNSTSSISVENGAPTYTNDVKPRDSHVLHMPWDNTGGYDSMLAVPNTGLILSDGSMSTVQWRTGIGSSGVTTDENGIIRQTAYTDWFHLIDDRFTIDGVHPKKQHVTHYGVCSTAAATAAKTVDIPHFELVTGAYVLIRFSVTNTAAVANLTLNVNGTGAKSMKYRNGNVTAANTLSANRTYMFVYDGTYWQLIGDLDTNSNNYERVRTYYPIKAKSAITAGHVIVADEDGLYFMLTSGDPFSIKYPPLYATSAISANAKSTNAYYFCFLDAPVITNEAAETLVLNKALYIKGHLNDTTFIPFATKSLVCTEPTTEDGYQYLKLGVVKAYTTSSDALRAQIEMEHPIYEYVNGSFCLYEPKATNSDIDSIFD